MPRPPVRLQPLPPRVRRQVSRRSPKLPLRERQPPAWPRRRRRRMPALPRVSGQAPLRRPRTGPGRGRGLQGVFSSVVSLSWGGRLQRLLAGFAGADAHHLLEVVDEDLSVTDLSRSHRAFDGFDHALDEVVRNGSFDLRLGKEVDDVFGAAIELSVALLAPE